STPRSRRRYRLPITCSRRFAPVGRSPSAKLGKPRPDRTASPSFRRGTRRSIAAGAAASTWDRITRNDFVTYRAFRSPGRRGAAERRAFDASPRVRLVLLDAAEDPVEVSGRDAGLAMRAASAHVDDERRAASRACAIGAGYAAYVHPTHERPVL